MRYPQLLLRRVQLSAVVHLALFTTAAMLAQAPRELKDPGAQVPHVRVMTYNIHHGAGNDACETPSKAGAADCGLNLERIAEVIREANADIVGLQEVDNHWTRSGNVNQANELARILGMDVCYGANLKHPADTHSPHPHEYGTAILSRFPLSECSNSPLPRVAPENEQRGLLSAKLSIQGKVLRFLNTHLSVVAADRVPQMKTAASAIDSSPAGEKPVATILVGDLNARPTEPSITPLLGELRDAWSLAAKGEGPTSPAHPQRPPRNRIDYVLVSEGVGIRSIEVVQNDTTALASDHYPVVAQLALP